MSTVQAIYYKCRGRVVDTLGKLVLCYCGKVKELKLLIAPT